eukprot:g260.t1
MKTTNTANAAAAGILLILAATASVHAAEDVSLKVNPGANGASSLTFLVYGDNGAEYTLTNDDHGTFRIENEGKVCLEVETQEEEKEQSFLEMADSEKSLLRSGLRKRDAKKAGSRHLLSKKPGSTIAKRIMAPGQFNVSGGYIVSISHGAVKVGATKQWKMIVYEDFHRGTVSDWKNVGDMTPLPPNNGISTCMNENSREADYYLGSYGKMEATKKYVLPTHSRLRIKGRFHFFDNWRQECVYVKINDKMMWTRCHKWTKKIFQFDSDIFSVCGSPHYPDRLSVPVDIVIDHTNDESGATEIQLALGGTIDSNDGTWGFDDLQIYIM